MNHRNICLQFAVVASFCLLFFCASTLAATVTLGWDPSPSPQVAGYRVFYGTRSGRYRSFVDAGMNLSCAISDLMPGVTYYFATTAYDSNQMVSPFSNEVVDLVPVPPVIVGQPVGQMVVAGAAATFAVEAASASPLTYQWCEGATPIPGATNAILNLSQVFDADAGYYSVVVNNSGGSVMSSVVTLGIIDPPMIVEQPAAQTVSTGGSVTLTAMALGSGPLSYQWFQNERALPGATSATLTVSNASGANVGYYDVTVQNAGGSAISSIVQVNVTSGFLFGPLVTTFNGLFFETNATGVPAMTPQTAGLLANCLVAPNGTYSGKISLGGSDYPISGMFSATGDDSEIVERDADGLSDLTVALHLDTTLGTNQITGLVSNMDTDAPWTAPLLAEMGVSTAAPEDSFLLVPLSMGYGADYGYIEIITASSGLATLSGYLADNTFILETVPISQMGDIPLYASLYGGLGLLEGWVHLGNGVTTASLTWIRPAGIITAPAFPAGFTNIITQ